MANNKTTVNKIKYPFFSQKVGLSGSVSVTPIIITSNQDLQIKQYSGVETQERVHLQTRERNGKLIEDLNFCRLHTPRIFHWNEQIYDESDCFTNKLKSALIDEMCKGKLYGYIYHTPLIHFSKRDVVQLYDEPICSENPNVKEVTAEMLPTINCSFCKKELILTFDSNNCECGMKYDSKGESLNGPCDECSYGNHSDEEISFIELPSRGSEGECKKCGRIYTDEGPKQGSCYVCQEQSVSIFNTVGNCRHCGLEYDPDGEPVGEFPDLGAFVGIGGIGWIGNCSEVKVYAKYNGDETWNVYHHSGHPGAISESDALDINELVESLNNYGFTLKTITKIHIENFADALKEIEK